MGLMIPGAGSFVLCSPEDLLVESVRFAQQTSQFSKYGL